MINKYKILERANHNFSNSEYDQALVNYALVLKDYPNSKEAYNGAILAEMAMSGEAGAEALFDYYLVLRKDDAEHADIIMSEILESMDGSLDHLSELFREPLKERLAYEDGILYEDFSELIKSDGNFKETFENIMFSTRVIITEKEDFVDFLSRLIDNNFNEMALSYLEGALGVYPNDPSLRILLRKLAKKEDNIIEN
jgi:tetratricopeptide (TPR) repeat protein